LPSIPKPWPRTRQSATPRALSSTSRAGRASDASPSRLEGSGQRHERDARRRDSTLGGMGAALIPPVRTTDPT
jgi:hypothetical protein